MKQSEVQPPLYQIYKDIITSPFLEFSYRRISNGPHWYSTFIESALQYWLTFTHSCTHLHIDSWVKHTGHTQIVNSSGAIRVRRLAQWHHDTQLGRARDRTSNLAVTSQPGLPPELMLHFSKRVCDRPVIDQYCPTDKSVGLLYQCVCVYSISGVPLMMNNLLY